MPVVYLPGLGSGYIGLAEINVVSEWLLVIPTWWRYMCLGSGYKDLVEINVVSEWLHRPGGD